MQRRPHAQQQHARDVEVERAVMRQGCRPQSFGDVQRCKTLLYVVVLLQLELSRSNSLTDHLVRKFKDSLGINMTMKKIFIFVPVQTMKIFVIFVVSSGHANLVRIRTN